MEKIDIPVVIVANGNFPTHHKPINILKKAKTIIACDGAADTLIDHNINPNIIIGDLDSLSKEVKDNFQGQIINTIDQSEYDLRKAINYIHSEGIQSVVILGATGKREDHTLGNIFSIIKYSKLIDIKILTDTGYFTCIRKATKIQSKIGQNISLFSPDNSIKILSNGLKYNFKNTTISTLFYGTLNESISKYVDIKISHGQIIIFQTY